MFIKNINGNKMFFLKLLNIEEWYSKPKNFIIYQLLLY